MPAWFSEDVFCEQVVAAEFMSSAYHFHSNLFGMASCAVLNLFANKKLDNFFLVEIFWLRISNLLLPVGTTLPLTTKAYFVNDVRSCYTALHFPQVNEKILLTWRISPENGLLSMRHQTHFSQKVT